MKIASPILVAFGLLVAGGPAAIAASERLMPEDFINLLRIDLRAEKAKVVTESMDLTADEAEVFWKIYREYDADLSKLNAERISVIRDFAANYSSIDDDKAREISRRTFEFMRKRLDLLEKYSRKIERAMSPVMAVRFAQIEHQLLMLVDVQIESEMPLIQRRAVGLR